MPHSDADLFLGIDLGTSQCRACAIDRGGYEIAFDSAAMPAPVEREGRIEQMPDVWREIAMSVLARILATIAPSRVRAVAVAGTSGTLLLADRAGRPLGPALRYRDQSSVAEARRVDRVAPPDSAAHGASSALAKLLQLAARAECAGAARALHQADWLAGELRGEHGVADENNALKLGYDPVRREWPAWIAGLGVAPSLLPRVVAAGTPIGTVSATVARRSGLAPDVVIVAGTTDSVAAALASGIAEPGDALTSLGSTLVLKIVTAKPFVSAAHGVYTHRLRNRWLAGGASNTGGAVLASIFPPDELARLAERIDPERASPLDYYPLLRAGERFPVNDSAWPPRLVPRPLDDAAYLHGLLESIARIERDGYRLLERLGAPYPRCVRTAGGGAANPAWRRIRARVLGAEVAVAEHAEAAYGAALLARGGAG